MKISHKNVVILSSLTVISSGLARLGADSRDDVVLALTRMSQLSRQHQEALKSIESLVGNMSRLSDAFYGALSVTTEFSARWDELAQSSSDDVEISVDELDSWKSRLIAISDDFEGLSSLVMGDLSDVAGVLSDHGDHPAVARVAKEFDDATVERSVRLATGHAGTLVDIVERITFVCDDLIDKETDAS